MFNKEPDNLQDFITNGIPMDNHSYNSDRVAVLSTRISITEDDVFLYDSDIPDTEIANHLDDVQQIMSYHEMYLAPKYKIKHDYYIGRHHTIINQPKQPLGKPDNRIIFNLPKKLVSTFNGYFSGDPVSIRHQSSDGGNDADLNNKIKYWLNSNDYEDIFSTWSERADIYGRSYLYLYEDPSIANTQDNLRIAICSPTNTIVVYDNTVKERPVFAIRYYDSSRTSKKSGEIITKHAIYEFTTGSTGLSITNVDPQNHDQITNSSLIAFPYLPMIELAEDDTRTGLFDDSLNLIDSIDNIMSSKANDNDAFNQSYLVIIGAKMDEKQMTMLKNDRLINLYQKNTSTNSVQDTPTVAFLSPDSHDQTEENYLDRAIDMVYQISDVVNLNDSKFGISAQSISGVALLQKYQPMLARARVKAHKMDQALRQMFAIVFDQWSETADPNNLTFDHKQSIPHNNLEEAQTVQTLNGQVSDVTKLGYLSRINDPAAEVERLAEQDHEEMEESQTKINQYLSDQQKEISANEPNNS